MGANPQKYQQQSRAAAVALEEAIPLNFFCPVPEMGGSGKIIFFFFAFVAPVSSSVVQRSVEPTVRRKRRICGLEREEKESWFSHRGQPRALLGTWGKISSGPVTRACNVQSCLVAEDLELCLIMVQSIKSYQLVSLIVFGGGL